MAEITLNIFNKNTAERDKVEHDKSLWVFPWLYRESFLMALGLLIIGFILEYQNAGSGANALQYPFNVVFGGSFILIAALIKILFKKHQIIKWLGSVPASISAIASIFLMVILLGLIPQENTPAALKDVYWLNVLGLTHITTSWAFILSLLFLLTTLSFAIFKRLHPFTFKNFAFFINHAGLWIALFGGFLGTGDFKRVKMNLFQDDVVWEGIDEKGNATKLPLALKLNKFDIEEYNPKLVFVDQSTWKIVPNENNSHFIIDDKQKQIINGWEIEIDRFYKSSFKNGGTFESSEIPGSGPAAYIRAKNIFTGAEKEGWITCGTYVQNAELLKITEGTAIAMTMPEPKRFSSEATLFTPDGRFKPITLEVNKPYSVGGWKMYQTSYDDRFGKWSQLSVIELIKDPWLPVVYCGIFMMIAGAIYMLWIGNETASKYGSN